MTPFTLLLLNLSISDLIVDMGLWPYMFIDLKNVSSKVSQSVGNFLCSIHIGLTPFWMAGSSNIYTLSLISFFRFTSMLSFSSKFNVNINMCKTKSYIAAFWVISVVSLSPHFFGFWLDRDIGICYRKWPEKFNGLMYVIITSFFFFFIPATALVINFVLSAKFLWGNSNLRSTSTVRYKARRRITKLYLALIAVFFICWTPMFAYILLARTTTYFEDGPKGIFAKLRFLKVVILISACNSVCDPVLYAFCGRSFRDGFFHNSGHFSKKTWQESKPRSCSVATIDSTVL